MVQKTSEAARVAPEAEGGGSISDMRCEREVVRVVRGHAEQLGGVVLLLLLVADRKLR